MAEEKGTGAPALDTNIESGGFHNEEKRLDAPATNEPVKAKTADEEEDEDMDALIEDLESQDGHVDEEEEGDGSPGGGRSVPEDMLQTDSRVGLTEHEVISRRKKYGLNQMKEEKENLILKFFGYFIGPIQFVMEVRLSVCFSFTCLLFECGFYAFFILFYLVEARSASSQRVIVLHWIYLSIAKTHQVSRGKQNHNIEIRQCPQFKATLFAEPKIPPK